MEFLVILFNLTTSFISIYHQILKLQYANISLFLHFTLLLNQLLCQAIQYNQYINRYMSKYWNPSLKWCNFLTLQRWEGIQLLIETKGGSFFPQHFFTTNLYSGCQYFWRAQCLHCHWMSTFYKRCLTAWWLTGAGSQSVIILYKKK